MSPRVPRKIREMTYARYAQEYMGSLPPEHFMEATPQATQREITLASFAVLRTRRPDFAYFNELLVQYPVKGRKKPGQVVPDNMAVLTTEPISAVSNYAVELEPARPFWVLEYVSKESQRKDYEESLKKYERDLRVPYYLVFNPDTQDLTLYRLVKGRYVSVKPNRQGRYPIRELDVEAGLVDGWVRYWHEGELLPLPADLQRDLDDARRERDEARSRADREGRRADEEKRRADDEKRRADEADARADDLTRRLEAAERELAARSRQGRP